MRLTTIVFLFFVIGAAVADQEDFVGRWLDNFGFEHSICLTDNGTKIQGAYSQFGIIQGDVSGVDSETVTGRFYEAWYAWNPLCHWGNFTWHINGNSINGRYVCNNEIEEGEWSLTKVIPQTIPTAEECVVLSSTGTADGSWAERDVDSLDICVNNNGTFEASYNIDNGNRTFGGGYLFGESYESGRILRGSWVQRLDVNEDFITGGVIFALTPNRELTVFSWRSPYRIATVADQSARSTIYYNLPEINATSVTGDCKRNDQFHPENYFSVDSYFPDTGSNGNALLISLVSVILAVIAVC